MSDQEGLGPGSVHGMDVRRLRYFTAVAEELHFGRAAERLNVAQAALSRQIAHLEGALGCVLFDRTRNQIKLTAAGEALLPRARDILLRFEEAARVTRRAAEGSVGVLEIGFVGSATYSILPEILKFYRAGHPRVDLLLYAMNTSELRHALVERRIQAAFARPGIDDPEIVNECIQREPLIVALPDDDPLAAEASLTLEALAGRPFVLYPRHPRPSFADTVLAICREHGFSPQVTQEVMDIQTALGLIAVGVGVSLLPASMERSHRHGVAYRPLRPPAPTTELSLSYRRDSGGDVLREFRATVRHFLKTNTTHPAT
ncbi:LysR family transcriptional regulator [Azospirillum ramasamyi]|uniref:LysR family transcriptional regulator n=1 Tax=Azospirillum ramasamyi TaxID=682998 RepID=A0A2U9SCU0_9PROT|nr:LysR family transcriptional regulator [Azospirillum ramasamyi]AWU95489.1 LysR family transcriptional regulator [Azospirillum ramasamyi]